MGRTDVIGYLASSAGVPNLQLNTYFPGAIGDHMTSLGGYLFESSGQMSILEFIKYGLTGTYGTVIEPYNYREKFPHAMAHWWIARGFTLADSYWMSVQHPYMGLFVGEPLAAPYASSPTVNITSPTNGSVISGLELLTITAAATLDPVAVIDVFVDDVFLATVTNEAPSPGNVVTATISGTDVSYTVMTNDTLEDVAVGLAAAISAAPGLPVDALATPDRVMLVYTNYGATGSHIDYSVSCSTGTAPVLSLHATALSSNLLETLYQARELLYVSADAPDAGDKLRLVITLESALSFTNEVTASGGETASDLLSSLFAAVNSDTNLQNADGVYAADFVTVGDAEFWLRARTAGPQGYNIAVDFAIEGTGLDTNYAFADQFNDNAGDMTARGQILLAEGLSNLVSSYTFDTTAYADGPHRLTAIAYDGSARQTQGAAELAVVVSNSALSCVLSEPTNNYATTLGSSVTTRVAVAGAVGTVTQVTFFVEGKPIGSDTTAPFELSWQTLGYGAGSVTVRAQALDDAGPSAVSAPAAVLITSSSDADQDALPDTWERTYFGGIYPQAGTNDADGDAAANWEEYVAGTVPTNDASVFEIVTASNISDTNAVIQWSSVAGKTYAVDGGSNLTAGLSAIVSNLPATPPQNSYTNTSGVFPAFFRIRVE
jgi:hypothetical protein